MVESSGEGSKFLLLLLFQSPRQTLMLSFPHINLVNTIITFRLKKKVNLFTGHLQLVYRFLGILGTFPAKTVAV